MKVLGRNSKKLWKSKIKSMSENNKEEGGWSELRINKKLWKKSAALS